MQLIVLTVIIHITLLVSAAQAELSTNSASTLNNQILNTSAVDEKSALEPRYGDRSFIKDIVDRLHALDADIGKMLYNSTSMYAPDDQNLAFKEAAKEGGGQRFTEILNDLDSLQDEIGVLVNNATRTRQYNILIRLRPLNTLLYRIRHNLHLMRNSLVAINTVASLEKLGNSVLDSTLQAFMRPDANLNDEVGDSGNYDINLDRPEDIDRILATNSTSTNGTGTTALTPALNTTTRTTTTTTTTTTLSPSTTASTTTTTASPPSSISTTTKRPTQRPTRRANNRQNNRRSTTVKPTSSTIKPEASSSTRSVL